MQYFSKKKLVLPEGYFVNSSQIPLGFLQVSLLRRLRDQIRQPPISESLIDKDESRRAYSRSELLRGALLTINGIAAGMRNTG